MKILKLNIERCGDCPNITFTGTKGWICDNLLEQVHPEKIALLCPLEDDAPKTCATCRYWPDLSVDLPFRECKYIEDRYGRSYVMPKDFGCIHHEVKKCK